MASELWEWITTFMSEFQKSTERVREWTKKNMERRREINRKAAKTFYDKNKNNPEYMEKRRGQKAEWARKNYKSVAEMTPEELEAAREERRIKMREYRKRKKEEALAAQQDKENGPA